MSTANRAFKKIYEDERDGRHDITYSLYEAMDKIVSGDFKSEDQVDVIRKEIEKRMTQIIDCGVRQTRIEMGVIGISVIAVGGLSYCICKKIKKIVKHKESKPERE